MKSVLDDCLAQFSSKYVLKEEQRQAAAKGCCQLSAALKLKQREKNVELVLSPLRPYQI